jgi:hypothetical protein
MSLSKNTNVLLQTEETVKAASEAKTAIHADFGCGR